MKVIICCFYLAEVFEVNFLIISIITATSQPFLNMKISRKFIFLNLTHFVLLPDILVSSNVLPTAQESPSKWVVERERYDIGKLLIINKSKMAFKW